MWQADIRRPPLCAALPLRSLCARPGRAGRAAARPDRTMYAATMRPPRGVCTDPV